MDATPDISELALALDTHAAQFGPHHPETITAAGRLAVAFWSAGDIHRALGILDQALSGLASSLEPEHSLRIDLLSTLGDIFVEQTLWEQASVVYREILDCCVSRSGEAHPSSLAAQGDLAIVLFELGQSAEAIFLEAQALERANIHLGPLHSVTSILAWNIALRHEHCGDFASSSRIIADDLSWLLTIEDAGLDQDQQTIKALLSRRLSWDAASAC